MRIFFFFGGWGEGEKDTEEKRTQSKHDNQYDVINALVQLDPFPLQIHYHHGCTHVILTIVYLLHNHNSLRENI